MAITVARCSYAAGPGLGHDTHIRRNKRGYLDAPRRRTHWLAAGANAASVTPQGVSKDHLVLAPPKTCPGGGKRYVRNRVRVPGLAAVSQAIGCRKAPTYCLFAKRGGSVKLVCLRSGPSPRQAVQYKTTSKASLCLSAGAHRDASSAGLSNLWRFHGLVDHPT